LGKYFYGIFPNVDYQLHPELMSVYYRDFFPWCDLDPKMDARNFWYLTGERFMDMVQFALLCKFFYRWQTVVIWILSIGYIFDFMITFHTSYYGEFYMFSIGGIGLLSMLIPVIKHYVEKWKA
jgi:hypothetical protein